MAILIAAIRAIHLIFAYLISAQATDMRNETANSRQSKRDHSLLLKALKARRQARQKAQSELREKQSVEEHHTGKADET